MAAQQEDKTLSTLRHDMENIADQLCIAVKGEFEFALDVHSVEDTVQKLSMLINFVLDAARRSLSDVKEKNAKLTELDKMKSDFLANISHELRTPLTLILGALETILADHSLSIPTSHLENLQRMRRNAARLYMLVNDVLDFAKLEAGKFEVHE